MSKTSHRHLKAILFIDIVGYTAMMQRDEREGLAALQRFREVIEDSVEFYNGKVVNHYGDGCLCSFQSVVDATECAKDVQEALREPYVPARIGIHLGEVVEQEGNLYGDGVNVASRIESLGTAGSVLFSKQAAAHLNNHPGLKKKSLGSFTFKNVGEPVEVFALANEGFPIPQRHEMKGKLEEPSPMKMMAKRGWPVLATMAVAALLAGFFFSGGFKGHPSAVLKADWQPTNTKSIAVLPFSNLDANEENVFFSEGIMEETLTQLQKISDLKVMSRTSVLPYQKNPKRPREIGQELDVAYLLEGSVRRQGSQVKVRVSLVNVLDEIQLWSHSYEGELIAESIFKFQNELAGQISTSLQAQITPQEEVLLATIPTRSQAAYDFYLRGHYFFNRQAFYDKTYTQKALDMYEGAIKADSTFALAHLFVAGCHRYFHWFNFDKSPERVALAKRHLAEAKKYVPGSPEVLVEEGWQLYHFDRNYDGAIAIFEKAKEIAPKNIHIYSGIGSCYKRVGEMAWADSVYNEALVFDPNNQVLLYNAAQATEHDRNVDKTIAYLEKVIRDEPDKAIGYALLARVIINGRWDLKKANQLLSNPANDNGFLSNLQKFRLLYGSGKYNGAVAFLNEMPGNILYDGQNDFYPKALALAWCYRALGKGDEKLESANASIDLLNERLRQYPDDFRFHRALAVSLALAGQKGKSLEEAQTANELMPLEKDMLLASHAQQALLDVYIINGQYKEALEQVDLMMSYPGQLTVAILKNDPTYEPLRNLPQFDRMMKQFELKG